MSGFTPKTYQSQVLESIEQYFTACHELPSASVAFNATTERLWGHGLAYNPLANFPADMPYFCLRVPTGGGKTWLAAKSIQLVNTHLLRCEHSVILWLVPSKPIREQTLRSLKKSATSLSSCAARNRPDYGDGSGRSQEHHASDTRYINNSDCGYSPGVSGR